MAINKRFTDTNGVLELNSVTFERTGNIMAMYPLDEAVVKAENGMLLGVNYAGKKIVYPAASADAIMLNFSIEKEYDSANKGLNKCFLQPNKGFYPRLGKLEVNDRFTTTAVAYDSAVFADMTAIKEAVNAGTVYGKACETEGYKGLIELTKTAPTEKVGLKAIECYTVANGEPAIKFSVVKAD